MNENEQQTINQQVKFAFENYRNLIMDCVQQECENSPRWSFIRGRLLRFLGDSGLYGKISEIIDSKSSRCA